MTHLKQISPKIQKMTQPPDGKYFDGEYFSVPRSMEGETAVCIASGPHLSDDDIEYVREMKRQGKCRIFVCNNNYLKVPEADVHFFCDKTFWVWHVMKPEFQAFKGEQITLSKEIGDSRIKVMNLGAQDGLSFRPDTLRTGGNSGYMQINLAFLYGCKRVILLGYEMMPKVTKDHQGNDRVQTHWFGSHPQATPTAWFGAVAPNFETMVPDLKEHCLEVINCTKPTAIQCFPHAELRDVLK